MRQRASSSGFGLVELLMVVAIIGVLVAINTPALLRARAAANEAGALASLRAVGDAQRAFAASCGGGFYAPTLYALGRAPEGRGDGFLSPDLSGEAPVVKNGYELVVDGDRPDVPAPGDPCNRENGGPEASELLEGYFATATTRGGFVGSRNFWTNTTGGFFEKPQNTPFVSQNTIGGPEDDPDAAVAQGTRNGGTARPNAHTIPNP